ncbi:hypothetical protein HYC85_026522 [Camellia sinensis]|uniref:Uncharacterized protein n=1 Tax=Camellia sinensis TaxID=4442 RepID=A0A7J7G3T0_CAMSI|nr:hypothetical protein HYC85_026522 [Camellia sinensis]
MEKLKIAPSISNRYLGKQRAEPTLPLSSERPCGRQRSSHPIGLATSMSGAYSPLFGAPQRFLLVAIAQLQSSNPRMGCILRCQYKLPENQYATTSSTTEEEVKEGLMKTPTILESLYKHAEIDPTLRHIAAYRVGPYFMTNRTIVNSVFERYGEKEHCMFDFDFDEDAVQVLFKHQNSAVLKEPYLKIGDYLTRCMRPPGSGAMLLWMDC